MTGTVSRETRLVARAPKGRPRKIDEAEFVAAWNAGVTARELAERFNLHDAGYVTEIRRRLGLKPRGWGGPRVRGQAAG